MSMQFKSQRRFICLKAIEFKRIVFVLNAGKICKHQITLPNFQPFKNYNFSGEFYFTAKVSTDCQKVYINNVEATTIN